MRKLGWLIPWAVCLWGATFSIAQELELTDSSVPEVKLSSDSKIELLNALTRSREVIEISAEVSGPIKSLSVMEGSRITIGQEVAKIKDERAALAMEKAKLEWDVADRKQKSDIAERLTEKASLVAGTEYERAMRANKEIPNTYAESEVDRRKLVYEKAKLEIEQAAYERALIVGEAAVAKNGLDQAMLELRRHQIISPVNGMVVSLKRQLGEWVEPGAPILEVVDLDFFRVEGFVTVDQAAIGLAGRTALVQVTTGSEKWEREGKVVFVSPEANPVNLQVRIIIEVPFSSEKERSSFRSGLKCKASVTVSEATLTEQESPASVEKK